MLQFRAVDRGISSVVVTCPCEASLSHCRAPIGGSGPSGGKFRGKRPTQFGGTGCSICAGFGGSHAPVGSGESTRPTGFGGIRGQHEHKGPDNSGCPVPVRCRTSSHRLCRSNGRGARALRDPPCTRRPWGIQQTRRSPCPRGRSRGRHSAHGDMAGSLVTGCWIPAVSTRVQHGRGPSREGPA